MTTDPRTTDSSSPATVLLIGPDDEDRISSAEMTRRAGYSVLIADEWEEGVELLRHADVDAVIVDEEIHAQHPDYAQELAAINPRIRAMFRPALVTGAHAREFLAAPLARGRPHPDGQGDPVAWSNFVAATIATVEKAELTRRGLVFLSDVTPALYASSSQAELLDRILTNAMKLFSVAARTQGDPLSTSAFVASVRSGNTISIQAAAGRFSLDDSESLPELEFARFVAQSGVAAQVGRALALPLAVDDDVVAVLWIEPYFSSDVDPLVVSAFCRQAAAALRTFELRQLASIDPLTGVYTRRFLDTAFVRELRAAHRFGLPLSILVVDLDRLKQINDTGGHVRGDQAIVQVAEVLRGNTRSVDIVGRFGGDEFVAVLPGTNPEGAAVVANRIIAAAGKRSVQIGERTLPIGVSVGSASLAPPSRDGAAKYTDDQTCKAIAMELLELADIGLYHAKQNGRGGHGGPVEISWDGVVLEPVRPIGSSRRAS